MHTAVVVCILKNKITQKHDPHAQWQFTHSRFIKKGRMALGKVYESYDTAKHKTLHKQALSKVIAKKSA